jgi:hypothetical protein
MSQAANRKQKSFLGMTSFQVGVLFILGLLACGVIGLLGFFVINNGMAGNGISGFNFTNPSSSIVGKWEIVSGTSIGSLYEFFPDGTVNISGSFGIATTYSFPDKTHIKIEMGNLATVYEYTLSGDELIFTNDSSVLTFKKYSELNLDAQVILGTWKRSSPDKSECFKGAATTPQESTLGVDMTPQEITFGTDGAFSLLYGGYYNFVMNGQYFVNGNNLRITASGTHDDPGVFGVSDAGAPPIQIQREFNCTVTISNSRLNFTDALGQNSVFVRAGE